MKQKHPNNAKPNIIIECLSTLRRRRFILGLVHFLTILIVWVVLGKGIVALNFIEEPAWWMFWGFFAGSFSVWMADRVKAFVGR